MRKTGVTDSYCQDVCCCISGLIPCFLHGAIGRVRTKIRKDYQLKGNVARGTKTIYEIIGLLI